MLFDSEFMFHRIVSVDGNLHLLGAGIDPPMTSLKLPAVSHTGMSRRAFQSQTPGYSSPSGIFLWF